MAIAWRPRAHRVHLTTQAPYRRRRRVLVALAIAVLLLALLRLALPFIVRDVANRKLAARPDYRGRVERVRLGLWRGAYRLEGLRLDKVAGAVPVPFFACDAVDLSLEWRSLLRGRIVGSVFVDRPTLNLVKGPDEAKSQTKMDKSWADTADEMMPLTVNRLVVNDGLIRYRDFHSAPRVDIALDRIEASATNLSTVRSKDKLLPAELRVRARCFGSGELSLAMAFDPLSKAPTFELKETLRGVQLAKLNDFFEAYAKLKVRKGDFGLYTEIAAKDGSFVGYSKPFIRDLEIGARDRSALKKVWAGLASAVTWVFSDKEKEQLATKIPIKGTFQDPSIGVWAAVGGLLQNAFVESLSRSLDNTIRIADVPAK